MLNKPADRKVETQHSPSLWLDILRALMINVLSAFAGACLGLVLTWVYFSTDWFVLWRPLGAPPEAAVRIVSAFPYDVYVLTQEGRLYARDISLLGKWKLVGELPSPYPILGSESCARSPVPVAPFAQHAGETRDCMIAWEQGPDNYERTVFLLREGGNVWAWHRSQGGYLPFIVAALSMIVGAIAGYLSGVIISAYLVRRRARLKARTTTFT